MGNLRATFFRVHFFSCAFFSCAFFFVSVGVSYERFAIAKMLIDRGQEQECENRIQLSEKDWKSFGVNGLCPNHFVEVFDAAQEQQLLFQPAPADGASLRLIKSPANEEPVESDCHRIRKTDSRTTCKSSLTIRVAIYKAVPKSRKWYRKAESEKLNDDVYTLSVVGIVFWRCVIVGI